MAMSVTYTNFGSRIVTESRDGTVSHYAADTLGSTVALVNTSGTITDTWSYWPYGEVQARTGTTATPFTFGAVVGYFQDLLNNFTYVRMRFLRVALARWQTVDPLWPSMRAYEYADSQPNGVTDPMGLGPCDDKFSVCLGNAQKNWSRCENTQLTALGACLALCGVLTGGVGLILCAALCYETLRSTRTICDEEYDCEVAYCSWKKRVCDALQACPNEGALTAGPPCDPNIDPWPPGP